MHPTKDDMKDSTRRILISMGSIAVAILVAGTAAADERHRDHRGAAVDLQLDALALVAAIGDDYRLGISLDRRGEWRRDRRGHRGVWREVRSHPRHRVHARHYRGCGHSFSPRSDRRGHHAQSHGRGHGHKHKHGHHH